MAQARITINSVTGRLKIAISGPEFLDIGNSYDYTASVTDSSGNIVDTAGSEFQWRVVPPKLGTVTGNGTNATFVPNTAGRGVIIVDVKGPNGTGTGRISITVNKG